MRKRITAAAIIAAAIVVATPGVSAATETVNWSTPDTMPNAGTSATPAMARCASTTFMVWKGLGNDTRMWYSWLGTDGAWAPQQVLGGGGGTSTGPTATCGLGTLVVAWKGIGTDEHMYYTSAPVNLDGNQPFPLQFAGQQLVSDQAQTDLSPSIATTSSDGVTATSYLAWHMPNTTAVETASLVGTSGPWQLMEIFTNGVSTNFSPTLTVGLSSVSFPPSLGLIWSQAGSQQVRYSNYLGGRNWSNPAPLVGGSAAAPAATGGMTDTDGSDNLVVWQGAANDTHIWYTVNQNQTGWQPQQVVATGGPTTTGLAAADSFDCPTNCGQFTAYIAWQGPQGQIEFVHGQY